MKISKIAMSMVLVGALGSAVLFAGGDEVFECRKVNTLSKFRLFRADKSESPFAQKRGEVIKIFQSLDLSDDQKEQLNDLRKEMRETMKSLRDPQKAKEELLGYFSEEGFDKDGFVNKVSEKFDEKIKIRADYIEKMYNILTPDQRKELIEGLKDI